MENLRVAIIGAGPAGCMLARLLHLGGLKATVFEGEASRDFRTQGGTLDLHTDTGLAAVKEAGLWDEFKKHARYDGQYMAIVDKNLEYHVIRGADEDSVFGERPEIDRIRLREILLDSLPEGTVKWGHHLQKVEGKTLVFDSATASDFDLIVGADGAWSKARKAIAPELQPEFSQVAMHDLSIPDAQTTAPEIYELVNRGSIFASADGQRVGLQQLGDGGVQVYASFVREDPEWMKPERCGFDSEDLDETKAFLTTGEFADWCPQLRDAFNRAQGKPITRSLFRLPVGSKWEHKPGFTLIGDAAHLMTPHAGEGVNQALEDAMKLANVVLKAAGGDELDEQIRGFEEDMFVRAGKIQQLSYDLCQDWLFTPGAPKTSIASFMRRHQARAKAIEEAMAKAQVQNKA